MFEFDDETGDEEDVGETTIELRVEEEEEEEYEIAEGTEFFAC
jgi:hypothetical protein